MSEATPEMVNLGLMGILAMNPAALQARMGALLAIFPQVEAGDCQCDVCETLRGIFQGIMYGDG